MGLRVSTFRWWSYPKLFRWAQLITWVFRIGKPLSVGFRIRKRDMSTEEWPQRCSLLALRQSRDWTSVPPTVTMKSSIPCQLKPYACWVACLCRNAKTGCLPKEGLSYKDWWRPNLIYLHQSRPQCWPFTHFFYHYNTKIHIPGWRFNMLKRHVHVPYLLCLWAQLLISLPTPTCLDVTPFLL